jgi:hypothetical protein
LKKEGEWPVRYLQRFMVVYRPLLPSLYTCTLLLSQKRQTPWPSHPSNRYPLLPPHTLVPINTIIPISLSQTAPHSFISLVPKPVMACPSWLPWPSLSGLREREREKEKEKEKARVE